MIEIKDSYRTAWIGVFWLGARVVRSDERRLITQMPTSGSKSNTALWETGFAALCSFRARAGHCCPPRDHIERKFPLGAWVVTQRYYFSKGRILPERKRRLDTIGFVWDYQDYRWEQNFAALLKFRKREGHTRVSLHHKEGKLKLGYWVSTQRRTRQKMSAERRTRLSKIGFVWRGASGNMGLMPTFMAESEPTTRDHHKRD